MSLGLVVSSGGRRGRLTEPLGPDFAGTRLLGMVLEGKRQLSMVQELAGPWFCLGLRAANGLLAVLLAACACTPGRGVEAPISADRGCWKAVFHRFVVA